MRTTRIRTTALAVAATALAFSVTACGSSDKGDAKADGKASGTGGAAAPAGAGTSGTPGDTGSATGGSDSTASGSTGGSAGGAKATHASGRGSQNPASSAARQCKGEEISFAVLHRFPKQNGEHLLITARNADSRPCWVTSYPSVMLGDTSTVLRHSTKDAVGGGARITLQPGGRAYSAVNLFSGGGRTHTTTGFSIALRDRTGDTGPATELDAFDAKGAVSPFTWSEADVTNWNTVKPYDF
ncbi:DUF4232 domain-containing protein [Streptomyces sp. NPDC059070]|uniref:DUF4232 domain-containing protein n=1 Tax=unclassified Streptomyces TaxID=2593676 RepID=UPI0034E1D9B0